VLDVFEQEGVLEQAARQAEMTSAALSALARECSHIGDVRGLGAMMAIEIVSPADDAPDAAAAQRIVDRARAGGLLLLKAGIHKNVIRLLPPLTTPVEDLARGLEIFADACRAR